nr:MAG TPA: hypothetical protein [Caudoviricetes sp.]
MLLLGSIRLGVYIVQYGYTNIEKNFRVILPR